MSSTSLLIALLLVVGTLSLRLEDLEVRREYRKGRPEMLWQRGLIPEYEDDPEVYRDTAWLMDKVITTRAEIQYEPVPPVVVYRHGNGEKQEYFASLVLKSPGGERFPMAFGALKHMKY
ncbi:uncharacterized protein LOC141860204 isoform X2 [Acropora palmata]|uniref:uncharacterized protein LOC141860204 isoform X2 n=1 Tax=Acropora palmata TaxID=6131 RepID=UPI003D9FD54B